jgi:4-hydroxy-2-oxoheptanedioate aldolase
MLFIGPNDLASSLGHIAFDHAQIPEVQQATQRILDATLAAGKYAGHFALDPDTGQSSFNVSRYKVNKRATSYSKIPAGFPLCQLRC